MNAGAGVAYNGSRYVAVGFSSSNYQTSIQTSVDGIQWSNAVTGGFAGMGMNVAYGGGQWVAVGMTAESSADPIQTSTDGLNWSLANSNSFTNGNGVAYNSNTNLWVAAGTATGSAQDTLQWSLNGVDWNPASSGGFSGNIAYGVATSGPLWIATGVDPTPRSTIQWSTDGSNWNPAESGGFHAVGASLGNAYNVAYSAHQGLWVAVGNSFTDSRFTIQWSMDGSNWNRAESGGFDVGSVLGGGIAYSQVQNRWVATGDTPLGGTSSILHSVDGSNWSPATSGGFPNLNSGSEHASGFGVVATNAKSGVFISPSSISVLQLTGLSIFASTAAISSFSADYASISTANISTLNGVPSGQGYTDTTTFQYNHLDPVLGFQAGVPLSNASTVVGYTLNRPLAPINYFNFLFNGSNANDPYAFQLSSATSNYGPFYFSTTAVGTPESYEQMIPPVQSTGSQLLSLSLDPGVSGLTLYSLTLGYN